MASPTSQRGYLSQISIGILPDGRIVSGNEDGKVKIWDSESGSLIEVLEGHTGSVFSVLAFSNIKLISGSGDRTIKIWEVPQYGYVNICKKNLLLKKFYLENKIYIIC
jgi:WD40 repeat protein